MTSVGAAQIISGSISKSGTGGFAKDFNLDQHQYIMAPGFIGCNANPGMP